MKTLNNVELIYPDWPAPPSVRAVQTTRKGGYSSPPYDSLNFGLHVGDNAITVAANRQLLNPLLPAEPLWLNQVHGVRVAEVASAGCQPDADASYADRTGAVCVVMTADCLPLLLCDVHGTEVAAVHAGWKGLLEGVIEASVKKMHSAPEGLLAWLGPAIGPEAFEVGDEVRNAFIQKDAKAATAFQAKADGKWLADIYLLARQRLSNVGVNQVFGGGFCTYTDKERFFSFRRDNATGRMASLIWLQSK